jgi:hypothetical protein
MPRNSKPQPAKPVKITFHDLNDGPLLIMIGGRPVLIADAYSTRRDRHFGFTCPIIGWPRNDYPLGFMSYSTPSLNWDEQVTGAAAKAALALLRQKAGEKPPANSQADFEDTRTAFNEL